MGDPGPEYTVIFARRSGILALLLILAVGFGLVLVATLTRRRAAGDPR